VSIGRSPFLLPHFATRPRMEGFAGACRGQARAPHSALQLR
jgi:hypothetical protein